MTARINWVSILQGWTMLWVVLGHAVLHDEGSRLAWESVIFDTAYSFHMALFMFISGFLFMITRLGKWPYGKTVLDKIVRFGIPFVSFTVLAFVLKLAFPSEMSRSAGTGAADILHIVLYPNDNPMREFWFIATLFWFFLAMPLWKLSLRNKALEWTMLAALAVLHLFHPEQEFLCLNRVCHYAVFFYIGVLLADGSVVDRLIRPNVYWFALLGILLYAFGKIFLQFLMPFAGILVSICIALLLDKYFPRAFFTFRDYTYQIFLMGIFPSGPD